MDLAPVGHLWLVDPETDRQLLVDTNSRRLRERFAKAAADERADVARAIARTGAGHVVIDTRGEWLRSLASFVRGRRVAKAS
jgi:hypothetical protein